MSPTRAIILPNLDSWVLQVICSSAASGMGPYSPVASPPSLTPRPVGGLCPLVYSFWPIITPSVGQAVDSSCPVQGESGAPPSHHCIFWQVPCLVRVQLQSCILSRPSLLLAASRRQGPTSCYSPWSHLLPVTTCIRPSPVMVPFQYQAFLLQVKVRATSNHHPPRALKWRHSHTQDRSLGQAGGLGEQQTWYQPPAAHTVLWAVGGGWQPAWVPSSGSRFSWRDYSRKCLCDTSLQCRTPLGFGTYDLILD